jgi:hypothetical protein
VLETPDSNSGRRFSKSVESSDERMDSVIWPLSEAGVTRIASRMEVLPDMVWLRCYGWFRGRINRRQPPAVTADAVIFLMGIDTYGYSSCRWQPRRLLVNSFFCTLGLSCSGNKVTGTLTQQDISGGPAIPRGFFCWDARVNPSSAPPVIPETSCRLLRMGSRDDVSEQFPRLKVCAFGTFLFDFRCARPSSGAGTLGAQDKAATKAWIDQPRQPAGPENAL